MGIQAGTGGRHQVGGDVLHRQVGMLRQEFVDVALHALRQSGVGRAVVVGAGGHAGVLAAVVVELVALLIHRIGVVLVSGGAAAHEAGVSEVLAHVLGAHGLAVHIDDAAVGLAGEERLAHKRHDNRVDQTADQQQYQGHQNRRSERFDHFHVRFPPVTLPCRGRASSAGAR